MGLSNSEEKENILKNTIQKLDKQFGDKSVMLMDDNKTINIPVISTGSISLDRALGIGGFPRGRIIEIFGPESSGKTTLCLQCIKETQKLNGLAAFIDAEYAFDVNYAKGIGIDINKLYYSQPNNGEEALRITEELIKTNCIDIIVIDSVAALIPKAELEGEIGDSRIGLQARLMSQSLRKLTGIIGKTNCICIFINQLREKIGMLFGNPETTTGGNALKFYSSIRLDIRKSTSIKDENETIIGNRTKVKVVKNKLAAPFKTAEFDIIYGKGVDRIAEILDLCIEMNIIKKNGAWFSFEENNIAKGRDAIIGIIKNNKSLYDNLLNKINNSKI